MNFIYFHIMTLREFEGYSIVRKLPGGGMSHLHLALDGQQQRVVIRVLREEYLRDRRLKRSFLRGQKILAGLRHPNIVKLIDVGTANDAPYMILDYIESKNLRELIGMKSALLTQNILSLMRQLAAGLFHIHTHGFLHLDIKPENVLVEEDGHVSIIDFDLALKIKDGQVRMKHLPGTFAYLAPETLSKRVVDERSDIYSFGVMCNEMLSYHKPFEAPTLELARAAQINPKSNAQPLSSYNQEIPTALETIVLKCLANQPDDRYPSMSLVVKDLEAVVQ